MRYNKDTEQTVAHGCGNVRERIKFKRREKDEAKNEKASQRIIGIYDVIITGIGFTGDRQ